MASSSSSQVQAHRPANAAAPRTRGALLLLLMVGLPGRRLHTSGPMRRACTTSGTRASRLCVRACPPPSPLTSRSTSSSSARRCACSVTRQVPSRASSCCRTGTPWSLPRHCACWPRSRCSTEWLWSAPWPPYGPRLRPCCGSWWWCGGSCSCTWRQSRTTSCWPRVSSTTTFWLMRATSWACPPGRPPQTPMWGTSSRAVPPRARRSTTHSSHSSTCTGPKSHSS
mmetsp:Transcript_11431/g.24567  ORF Transcript_11431/g.24567 Transcript_11431/m.24567 type:complete len:226 (+) Transcript_11431:554-1231(+)